MSASSQSEPLIVWVGNVILWALVGSVWKKTVMTCMTLKFEWWSRGLHVPSVYNLRFLSGRSNLRSNLTWSVWWVKWPSRILFCSIPRLQSSSHQVSFCFISYIWWKTCCPNHGTWLWSPECTLSEISPRLWVQGWISARLGSAVKMLIRSETLKKSLCFNVKTWWHGVRLFTDRFKALLKNIAMLSFFPFL